jgi:hypothetical protein
MLFIYMIYFYFIFYIFQKSFFKLHILCIRLKCQLKDFKSTLDLICNKDSYNNNAE